MSLLLRRQASKVAYQRGWLPTALDNWVDRSPQPTLPGKLSPQITAVPVNNPPFPGNDALWFIALDAQLLQAWPGDYQFVELGPAGGTQPYARRQLSPGTPGQSIDNPPPPGSESLPLLALDALLSQPDPYQYSQLGPATGTQPYTAKKLSPGIPGQSIDPPPTFKPWQPVTQLPDPQAPGPKWLSPGIPGQSVDNPPFISRVTPATPADTPLIAAPRIYVPQVAATAQTPFEILWLSTVLSAWVSGDPLPTLLRLLPAQLTAVEVDNPPPFSWATLFEILSTDWKPADPLPTLIGRLSPGIPGQSVDNPPTFKPWQPVTQLPDPQPPLPKWLSPGIPGQSVDNPPQLQRIAPQFAELILPQQPRILAPQVARADQPTPEQLAWMWTVLQNWVPPDPLPTLPRVLAAALLAVRVDNPPIGFRLPVWYDLPPDLSAFLEQYGRGGNLPPGPPITAGVAEWLIKARRRGIR